MFFQFSPVQTLAKKKIAKVAESEENAFLSLAPFTAIPKIVFENIKIGQNAIRVLLITNPTNRDIKLIAGGNFSDEIIVNLSWSQQLIQQNSEVQLEISWQPHTEGSWRHILHLTDGGKIRKDVPIVFNTISGGNKKSKKRLPSINTKKQKSPIRKFSRKKSPKKLENQWNFGTNGKENFTLNLSTEMCERRCTYTVFETLPANKGDSEQNFSDSLETSKSPEMVSPLKQIENIFSTKIEAKLQSGSFLLSPIGFTPNRDENFHPSYRSTEEKTMTSRSYCQGRQVTLFPRNKSPDLANISSETYIKSNISSETFTKGNISSSTCVKDNSSIADLTTLPISPVEPPLADSSFAKRLESLAGRSVRNTIEANLWRSNISPPKKPLMAIQEESMNCTIRALKRKSDLTISETPQKRPYLGITDWSKKGGAPVRIARKSSGLTINPTPSNNEVEITSKTTEKILIRDPFLLASVEHFDPFMTAIGQCDEEWMDKQELNFKKWLNALLTPQEFNGSDNDGHEVNIAKLWKECKGKKEIPAAPSRELISKKYHTNARLRSLRKSASLLYRSSEIQTPLSKVIVAIDNGKLSIRKDKDIHLDLQLQSRIMSIVLSYNTLWLRIGLETIYSQVIALNSNSDLVGIHQFLVERFFKDPYLLKKYKSIHSPKYKMEINKFVLKKFLCLVYFLDHAKAKKIIPHDPCLFSKKASIKDSKDCLVIFASETLSSMGDITKYLKYLGYVVSHKQTYINEFDYGVKCLGIDLRDGVRLTRIMEMILLKNNLTEKLRVPAISRLQKIHNMKIVFEALKMAGYEILCGISPKDIVDGHKEKTLSFLWQIIYKFEAPLMVKSVAIIQKWWRSKEVLIKRQTLAEIRIKRNNAAMTILKWYRKHKFASKLEKFSKIARMYLDQIQKQNRAAIVIQKYIRGFIVRKHIQTLIAAVEFIEEKYLAKKLMMIERDKYQVLKYSAMVIQRNFRAWQIGKSLRADFIQLKQTAIMIQRRFRAKFQMRQCVNNFNNLKNATIIIQRRFRAQQLMKLQFHKYNKLRCTAIFVQERFRAKLLMRVELYKFETMKNSAIIIQRRFRAQLAMRSALQYYTKLKEKIVFVQRRFRLLLVMKQDRNNFLQLKQTTIIVQQRYRAKILMRKTEKHFKMIVLIQRRFRAKLEGRKIRKDFIQLKNTTIMVQRRWKGKLLMRQEMNNLEIVKSAAIIIQKRFRAQIAMKSQLNHYTQLREKIIIIQKRFRSFLIMKQERLYFIQLKHATIVIQQRFKAKIEMEKDLNEYRSLKRAIILIQRRFRATREGKKHRNDFNKLKKITIGIQRRFRAKLLMKTEICKFQSIKRASVIIQRRFRARHAMKCALQNFIELKEKTILIQRRFRFYLIMKQERQYFIKLKQATILVQQLFRAKSAMRVEQEGFKRAKEAIVVIQRRFRAKLEGRKVRNRFVQLLNATIVIQRKFRATLIMKQEMQKYQLAKASIIIIQKRFRAHLAMKTQLQNYLQLKEKIIFIQIRFKSHLLMKQEREYYLKLKHAAIMIQQHYRAKMERRKVQESFRIMKEAIILIQRQFRAMLEGRKVRNNFKKLQNVTIMMQRRFRAKWQMRQELYKFKMMKNAAIVIQRRFRGQLAMKIQLENYTKLKEKVIYIQRRFRSYLVMKQERQQFIQFKLAAIVIQQRYRAKLAMRQQEGAFRALKSATITIQKYFKATLLMKHQRGEYLTKKEAAIKIQTYYRKYLMWKLENERRRVKAAIIIQKYVRGFIIRRKYSPEAIREMRRNEAAAKIQATWRSYKIRRDCSKDVLDIRKRLEKAYKNAIPANSLSYRCKEALKVLATPATILQTLNALKDIEFVTRRCKGPCVKLSSVLPNFLYMLIADSSRSQHEMEVSTVSASILINFYKLEPSKANSWNPEFVHVLLTEMMHWCDKETPLFPTISTLIWLFAHNEEYKNVIIQSHNFQQKLHKIKTSCERKEKMVEKLQNQLVKSQSLFGPCHNLPLPTLTPDWGLDYNHKPKIFINSMQACKYLCKILSR